MSCERIEEKLGITLILDSVIKNDQIFKNLENIISGNKLDIMLIFYCDEPSLKKKFDFNVGEIVKIIKFIVSVATTKVYCDIYTDLGFEKNRIIILNSILSKLDRNNFFYSVTPVYCLGIDVSKFFKNIQILESLKILGEVSCVISKENYEKDFKVYSDLKEIYSSVIANPVFGEEDWFFKKIYNKEFFYHTHDVVYENGITERLDIYSLRRLSNFKGYSCNKKNHIIIKLSGPTCFCTSDFIEGSEKFNIYEELSEIDEICDKEICIHEDNVSVFQNKLKCL